MPAANLVYLAFQFVETDRAALFLRKGQIRFHGVERVVCLVGVAHHELLDSVVLGELDDPHSRHPPPSEVLTQNDNCNGH